MEYISKLCALSLLAAIADVMLPEGKLRGGALTVVGLAAVSLILGALMSLRRYIL